VPGIFIWGLWPRESGELKWNERAKARYFAPVGDLGDKVPQKQKPFTDIVYRFLL